MVFGGLCFNQILLYSGFCNTIYGEIHIWRIQWIWIQMGIWQPHKRQMQPIVPKCYQTHTFWGSFFNFDPHCVYNVRFAVSDKHILWLGLWLFSSTGVPVQSDCRNFNFKKYPMLCKQNYRQLFTLVVCFVLCKIANQGPKCPYKHKLFFESCCLLFFSFGRDACRCIGLPQQFNMP